MPPKSRKDSLLSSGKAPADKPSAKNTPNEPVANPTAEPPQHWLQLNQRSGPPAHWLETVRKGAPGLLDPETVPTLKVSAPAQPDGDDPASVSLPEAKPQTEPDQVPDFSSQRAATSADNPPQFNVQRGHVPAENLPHYGHEASAQATGNPPTYEHVSSKVESMPTYPQPTKTADAPVNYSVAGQQPRTPERSVDWSPATSGTGKQAASEPAVTYSTRAGNLKPVELDWPNRGADSRKDSSNVARSNRKFRAVPLEIRPASAERNPAPKHQSAVIYPPQARAVDQRSVDYNANVEGFWLPLPEIETTEESPQPLQDHLERLEREQREL